jgi:hypothetical protein
MENDIQQQKRDLSPKISNTLRPQFRTTNKNDKILLDFKGNSFIVFLLICNLIFFSMLTLFKVQRSLISKKAKMHEKFIRDIKDLERRYDK